MGSFFQGLDLFAVWRFFSAKQLGLGKKRVGQFGVVGNQGLLLDLQAAGELIAGLVDVAAFGVEFSHAKHQSRDRRVLLVSRAQQLFVDFEGLFEASDAGSKRSGAVVQRCQAGERIGH